MDCFWGRLDNYISQLMPVGDPRWTMAQYVDLAQQLCGSPFTEGPAQSHGNLYIFDEVANNLRVANSYEFVQMTYT